MIYRQIFEVETDKLLPVNITKKVTDILENCMIKEGMCNVYLTGTTAGLILNEKDRMLYEDFRRMLDELAPAERIYHHPENAHSHLRASLLTQSITLPVSDGKLVLGDWQSILLWEFDTSPRKRKIIITVSN